MAINQALTSMKSCKLNGRYGSKDCNPVVFRGITKKYRTAVYRCESKENLNQRCDLNA
ncbi:hypothetical protein NTE_00910 [Candidatus Nitrososphaera evergladensis SR1]|uniref:Uncharacterized protein n=1 Tax=Candidatus Nitrososphaera evergladensis SR1 TaxID=1459636 RepID=A0A075MN72_9ARCH|nr:hypothetical protein NTE_00910 [Candidatus Nitrososphaera evergladensis SR1]